MGVNTAGLDAGSRSFKAYGQANGLLTNTPEVGDAVYFSDSAGTIKHVAIVTDVYNNGSIRSVSGDLVEAAAPWLNSRIPRTPAMTPPTPPPSVRTPVRLVGTSPATPVRPGLRRWAA